MYIVEAFRVLKSEVIIEKKLVRDLYDAGCF